MAKFIQHQPCVSCGSSDACAIYDDGSTWCYACESYGKIDGEASAIFSGGGHKPTNKQSSGLIRGEPMELSARHLSLETCKMFSYHVGVLGDDPVQIATYIRNGKAVAQKVRFKDKTFRILGESKNLPLFGSHLWSPGGKCLVITEGEIDALSVAQAQGCKWPVVSIPYGAQSARKAILENLEYVQSFEKVVLCFDMDEPGQHAAQECADVLTPGKAFICHLQAKDANEMLKAGLSAELQSALWRAQPHRPDGILSVDELRSALEFTPEVGLSYPWESLSVYTYGIRLHEVITLLAGSNVGKSEAMKEIAFTLLYAHNKKVGMVLLEETPQHTARCLLGKYLNKSLHIPGTEVSRDELNTAFDVLLSQGHAMIYDHRGTSDWQTIQSRIRYMAGQGVEYVIIDHLTAIAYGKSADTNEVIHGIMEELNKLVMELNLTVFLISHIRKSMGKTSAEEGGRVTLDDAYGSAAIKQRSNFVFALERNLQSENESDRSLATLRVLKDRYTGTGVGKTLHLRYNTDTGRLLETLDIPEFSSQQHQQQTRGNDYGF